MTLDLRLLAYSAVLAWLMILTASSLRSRIWKGLGPALSNRDAMPPSTPIVGRADRAAANMLENLVIFAVLVLAAHAANVEPSRLDLGARLFFYARVGYFAAYLAGITYLRTALWFVSLAGMALVLATLF
jgi:uncharacterized MAPEG superfamily protein